MATEEPAEPRDLSPSRTLSQFFAEARTEVNTFHSLNLGRVIAEAVCAEVRDALGERDLAAYQKVGKDLNGQISYLEDNHERLKIPRVVTAGLRTLQAYGNYAVHWERGRADDGPPAQAWDSAMASLALVFQWFSEGGSASERSDLDNQTIMLDLKKPEPTRPPPLVSMKLWGPCPDVPHLKFEGDTTPGSKLARLYAYYDKSCHLVRYIAEVVLLWEAEVEVKDKELAHLGAMFTRLAELRPKRIPRTIARDVEELIARRSLLLRAMKEDIDDAAPFIVEAEQRNLADGVREWFAKYYLRRTFSRWAWGAVGVALLGLLANAVYGSIVDATRKATADELRRGYLSKYCRPEPSQALAPFCLDLRKEAEAAAKKKD